MPRDDGISAVSWPRFVTCFALTRLLEAAWIMVILSAALSAEYATEPAAVENWKYWTSPDFWEGGMIVLAWYYIGFGYLIISAVVLCLARYIRPVLSALAYAALNAGVYALHAAAVVVFIFHGRLTPPFWVTWMATILFDAVMPAAIWQRLCMSTSR